MSFLGELSSLIVMSDNRNITAALICFLLEAAGSDLYSFNDLYYDIEEVGSGVNYFIQIRNPKYWLVDLLVSRYAGEIKFYGQVEEQVYLELGCEDEIYGPFHRPENANITGFIGCDDYNEFELAMKSLNHLFQNGPSARATVWADAVLEEKASEADKLLALIYLKLDFHLVLDRSYKDTELWILNKKDEDILIALLARASEEDLRNVAITEILLPSGEPAFVIKEVLAGGKISRILPLEGNNLYSSLLGIGLPNVFIPYNRQMLPKLRADYLGAMIDYNTHECILLDMENNDLVVSSIPNSAFQPINNIIQYVTPSTQIKHAFAFHDPFQYRRNPFLEGLIEKIHPSRMYKVLQLETSVPDKILVPLILKPLFRVKSPNLWLIPIENGDLLMDFLQDQDPRNFHIACVGEQGEPEFFLVKPTFAQDRSLPNHHMVFAADKEIPNLYLPCDQYLEPILQAKTYVQHLDIQPNELVILRHLGDGEIEVVKIDEDDVKAINHLEDIDDIIADFDYPTFDVEWQRPTKLEKPKIEKKKHEITEKPTTLPQKLVPGVKKKVPRRKKKKKSKVSWDDVAAWAQKSGASLPIDVLIEQFELSPQEFLEKMKDHVAYMKEWKKRRGI